MTRKILVALSAASAFALPQAAHADENVFAYSYGSETLPKGGTELYVWATDRRGKGEGEFNAQDYQIELEHALTNRFQVSLYTTFASVHSEGLEPSIDDIDRDFAFNGMKAAFKYSLLSPYTDGIGVALYIEPGYARYSSSSGEREDKRFLEGKLLLQKNFANDKAMWVGNIVVEKEWEKEPEDSEWEAETEFELSSGLAARVAKNVHLGAEGRYTSVYEHGEREKWALFAGPTVHVAAGRFWGTLSYQHQLDGAPNTRSDSLNLGSYTNREIRMKLGYNF
ncbi:DUF6662 family protein [Sphingomicrobium nitratireducens]|uniref:DUF6662 family protein n=1 Tax=Sphingomicrobium nitratireducens TaxID=2964666 RepID=UPI00223F2026|nr:DUF6662 family protein [Sphingomicrobium nitratireducens]